MLVWIIAARAVRIHQWLGKTRGPGVEGVKVEGDLLAWLSGAY